MNATAKRAEEILTEKRYSFDEVAELLPHALFEIGGEGNFSFINQAGNELLGYSQADIENGLHILDVICKEDYNKLKNRSRNAISGMKNGITEYIIQRKDGSRCPVIACGLPIGQNDIALGIRIIAIDISEQKRNEETLRRSAEKFGDIFKTVPEGIIYLRKGGQIIEINRAFEQIARINREEVIGENIIALAKKLLPSGEKRRTLPVIMKIIKGQNTAPFELNCHRKTLEVNAAYNRNLKRITAVIRDVTDRKRAVNDLRRSEEKFRTLVSSTEDIIFTQDLGFRYTNVYGRWFQHNNVPRELFLGRTVQEVVGEKEAKIHLDNIHKVLKGRNTVYEWTLALEEMQYHFQTSLSCLNDLEGNVTGVVGVSRDITKERYLEDELAQAQKLEAIGHLAGGIAHDFNNILTVIQGNAELMMLDSQETDPNYPFYKQIFDSAERAARLTRQLLLYSRRHDLVVETVDINETIRHVLKMLDRLIGEEISIQTEFDEELWTTRADPGQIEQVIINLSVNARDAMPNGGSLWFKTENIALDEKKASNIPAARPGKYIRITVKDTGLGIKKELMTKIFNPFFSTKEPGEGTGMGLSVVHGIIKKHKGWINVSSELDIGTTFYIYLLANFETNLVEEKNSESSGGIRGQGECIMVIEDDRNLLEYIATTLEDNGYKVYPCGDVNKACEIFGKHGKDLQVLLCDVILPKMKGDELADQLKALNKDLNIILSSGYPADRINIPTIKDKGYYFLQKPYKQIQLLTMLKEIIHDK